MVQNVAVGKIFELAEQHFRRDTEHNSKLEGFSLIATETAF